MGRNFSGTSVNRTWSSKITSYLLHGKCSDIESQTAISDDQAGG